MSVLEKARELGIELSKSEEIISMREAEAMMLHNPEAQALIKEFNEKQQALRMMQSQGRELTEEMKREVEDLEARVLENPYIYNFFKAQQTFEKVLEDINNIIGQAIGTASGCSCSSDCGTGPCDCEGCN